MSIFRKILNYWHINIKKDYKVILLDIDGVLNLIPQGRDKYGAIFHPHLVKNLKSIIDKTGAKIVITSTWRGNGFKFISDMWKDRGLPGEVIDITPYIHKAKRGVEIKQWLKNNPVTDYVIIDDDSDMLIDQMSRFVKTSGNNDHIDCVDIGYGLTKKCSKKATNILNRVSYVRTYMDRKVCYNDDGLYHNEFGPAVRWFEGGVEYWVNGVQYTENEFKLYKRINIIKKIFV